MKLSLSTTVWKYAFLALSTLISCAVMVFISCGVVALGGAGSVKGAYIVTILGSFVMCVAFLGMWASLRESFIMSMTFVAVGVVGIISLTIFMIVYAVMKEDIIQMTTDRVDGLWEQVAEKRGAMDKIQAQYSCCGRDSPQDYLQDEDDVLPKSCCLLEDCSDDAHINVKGCAVAAVNFVDDQSDYLILTTLGLIALKLLGVASAYYMGKSVQHQIQKMEQIVINE